MLGIKNFNYKEHKDIIKNFFSLAKKGKVPPNNPKGHFDGWGVGWYENKKANLHKSKNSIVKEKEVFFQLLEKIKTTKILIVHLRKSAWAKTNLIQHSHPFKDEFSNIIFAHNGTIYDYKKLFQYIKYKNIKDCLDSEVFFWLLISKFKNNLKDAFLETINLIKKKCKYSSLTCIFSDGKNLYSFRDFTKLENYYTLYFAKKHNTKIISSEPLDKNLKWQIIKSSELAVY